MNVPLPDGIKPGGGPNESKIRKDTAPPRPSDGALDGSLNHPPDPGEGQRSEASDGLPAGRVVPRGSRLTPERLKAMRIGEGFLTDEEKQLFIDILFEYEGAIAFTDAEMGMIRPEIEPPVIIHTVPHEPWQQQNLRLPKAMQDAATAIVKEKLELGILEHSQGPY